MTTMILWYEVVNRKITPFLLLVNNVSIELHDKSENTNFGDVQKDS